MSLIDQHVSKSLAFNTGSKVDLMKITKMKKETETKE